MDSTDVLSPCVLLPYVADVLARFEKADDRLIAEYSSAAKLWEPAKKLRSAIGLLITCVESLKRYFGVTRWSQVEADCARILEGMMQELDAYVQAGREEFEDTTDYPGLEALRTSSPDHPSKQPHYTDENRRKLVCLVSMWFEGLQDVLSKVQQPSLTVGPPRGVRELAQKLHDALSQHSLWQCGCKEHEGLLFMASHRGFVEENEEHISFDMLFSILGNVERRWQDTQVNVQIMPRRKSQHGKSKCVGFDLGGPLSPVPKGPQVETICSSIQRFQTSDARLSIVADEESMWELNRRIPRLHNPELLTMAKKITLREFLDSDSKPLLGRKIRTRLAVLLANSFLHLHGGPWLSQEISKNNIHFLLYGSRLSLRPYLSRTFSESQSTCVKSSGNISSQSRQRLALGVLLIELFSLNTIEKQLIPEDEPCGTPDDFDKVFFGACRIQGQWERIPGRELVASAIGACLDDPTRPSGIADADIVCADIIVPLERELREVCNIEPEQLDLRPPEVLVGKALQASVDVSVYQQETLTLSVGGISGATTSVCPELSHNMPESSNRPLHQLTDQPVETPRPASEPPQESEKKQKRPRHRKKNNSTQGYKGTLLGFPLKAKKPSSPSGEWFDYFNSVHQFLDQERIPKWRKTDNPIKIAILDTGINMNNHFLFHNRARIEAKSFLNDSSIEDSNGHGTHIAGLVLKLARNATIHVAKISKGPSSLDPNTIAKAIEHSVKHWKADIITMSFGFESSQEDPQLIIQESIRSAHNAGVLLFAAGHNCGGNERISYPANQEDHVICIGATNSKGRRTNDSPLNGCHFLTFGEDVESCGTKKSGTSFATPIAAATAALALDYLNHSVNSNTHQSRDQESTRHHVKKAKTLKGMKNILEYLCAPGHPNGFKYIAPWYEMSPGNQTVAVNLFERLRRV